MTEPRADDGSFPRRWRAPILVGVVVAGLLVGISFAVAGPEKTTVVLVPGVVCVLVGARLVLLLRNEWGRDD